MLNFSRRQFKESNSFFFLGQNEILVKMLPTYRGGIIIAGGILLAQEISWVVHINHFFLEHMTCTDINFQFLLK